jgi:hypothetical protein
MRTLLATQVEERAWWAGTPPSSTVRTDNNPKVRFSASLGEEPEVELVLV